ncbi:MAG: GNAT family N-acetyltransferase [Bacteroidetes bacterium]|nr:GNAT family N-acetyltransferase [Bacteroidota bacterium]
MSFNVRVATPGDLETVRAFAESTFRTAWESENDPAKFEVYCKKAFSTAQIASEINNPETTFLLAYSKGVLCAYMKLNFNRPVETLEPYKCLQIERLYVLESIQNSGLGSHLLQLAHKEAQNGGFQWIWLSVWTKSARSIRFYQRHGFEIFGSEIFWVDDDPQKDWLMKKSV